MASSSPSLTACMREASKEIHDTSDRLVNMKLGLVLTSPGLYGEALALFYPIYAKIEDIIELHKDHKQIGKIHPLLDLIRRAPRFQKDMEFYLTSDRRGELELAFQNGENPVMEEYLQHLDLLSKEDPVLVLAYIYHQYAGILAGGQIIKKIVQKALGLSKDSDDGVQCFCMSDKTLAPKIMMARMKKILNEDIVLTGEERQRVINEGVEVFRRNNALVNTIHTTNAWAEASRACLKRILLPLGHEVLFIATNMMHHAMLQLWSQLASALHATHSPVTGFNQDDASASTSDMADNLVRFIVSGSMNSPALFAALSETSRSPEPLLTIDGNEALKIALMNSATNKLNHRDRC